MKRYLLPVAFLWASSSHAIVGAELAPLIELVAGQVKEIEKLAEFVGVAKDQAKFLKRLNDGIEKTVSQIRTLREISERTKGLEPSSAQSVADLTDLLTRAKDTKATVEHLLEVKIGVANQAIKSSAIQSDTAYKMGQEMVATGSRLASESETASPGRASQISAAAGSAQMLSQGIELQTLAHVAELQAMTLELQKSQMEGAITSERQRREFFKQALEAQQKRRAKK